MKTVTWQTFDEAFRIFKKSHTFHNESVVNVGNDLPIKSDTVTNEMVQVQMPTALHPTIHVPWSWSNYTQLATLPILQYVPLEIIQAYQQPTILSESIYRQVPSILTRAALQQFDEKLAPRVYRFLEITLLHDVQYVLHGDWNVEYHDVWENSRRLWDSQGGPLEERIVAVTGEAVERMAAFFLTGQYKIHKMLRILQAAKTYVRDGLLPAPLPPIHEWPQPTFSSWETFLQKHGQEGVDDAVHQVFARIYCQHLSRAWDHSEILGHHCLFSECQSLWEVAKKTIQ